MTIEEYNRIDIRTGRPCLGWSDREWQHFYSIMREKVTPSGKKVMTGGAKGYTVNGFPARDDNYPGRTNYQLYKIYINSVLRTIRSGTHVVDFCYYIYQIADLLKYEPELKTRLNSADRYAPHFEVWLD